MKHLIISGAVLPAIELVLGCLWLAGGHDAAGRVLTFYWWATVAVLFGVSVLAVVMSLVGCAVPASKPSARAVRYWLRALFFARVIAQVAIGCTSLAVFSLTSWLFCRLALLLVLDGNKKVVGA